MAKWAWVKVPENEILTPTIQEQTRQRLLAHAAKILPEKASQIRIGFRGDFCYIDADEGDGSPPTHLCRLRWEGDINRWTLAFYTYSNEQYQPCVFASGNAEGTPEEALAVGAVYLS